MKKFGSKNSLVLFFVLTISLTWIWWIPMALGLWPAELRIVPSSLGGISPILTLWILQKWSNHKVDLNRIIASVHNWRTNIPWLLAAVFILPVLTTLGNILNYILGFEDQFTLLEPGPAELGLILIPVIPITFVANLITSSLFEEPGWRGFALPKLQEKLGRELGSFVIGSYWWLWHQMSNIAFGEYPTVLGYLLMLGHSFTIDSLFNLSKRNLLAAMFAHSSLFVTITYLYKTANILSSIILLIIIWTVIFCLRVIERTYRLPKSLTTQGHQSET